MYGNRYSEFMDYSAIDGLPNPGYGAAIGMPAGGPGNQDTNFDLLVQRMTDVLQNQFGLKPKNQGHVYTPLFPEWYHNVALRGSLIFLLIQSALGKIWSKNSMPIIILAVMRKN
jgi:hypothetical protein